MFHFPDQSTAIIAAAVVVALLVAGAACFLYDVCADARHQDEKERTLQAELDKRRLPYNRGYATHFHRTLLDIYSMDVGTLGPLNARKIGYVCADGKKYKGYCQTMRESKTFRSSEDAVRWVVEQDQDLNDRMCRREAESAEQTKKLREEWA